MSGTALDHPLIRGYLRELDAALAGSPIEQARELREQITAHLEDVLPAGAGEQEVAAALARLGSPASLAAEARAGRPAPSPAARATRRMLAALSRQTWRFWSIAVATVILVGLSGRLRDRRADRERAPARHRRRDGGTSRTRRTMS